MFNFPIKTVKEFSRLSKNTPTTNVSNTIRIPHIWLFTQFLLILLFLCNAGIAEAKILVVAPHPDDDLLIAAGVTRAAVKRGEEVKIVYVTNGDYSGLGILRQNEAVDAQTTHLGNPEDNLIFLGYPDGNLEEMYQHYPLTTDSLTNTNSGKTQTYGERGLGESDYHYYRYGVHANYNRSNLLMDLQDIISTFRPDQIITVAEIETHADHRTTYQAVRDAILGVTNINPTYTPTLNTMLVWSSNSAIWPEPANPSTYFNEPPGLNGSGLSWGNRESIDVPLEMQRTDSLNLKQRAIYSHASQGGPGDFIDKFAHKDEFYWSFNLNGGNFPPLVNAGQDQTVAQGVLVTLDGSASFDPQGTPLQFQWRQISGKSVTLSDSNSAKPTFTSPANLSSEETLVFELRVSDGQFLTLPDHVSVKIPTSSSGDINIAAFATISASSENSNDGQTAAKAIDGFVNGYPSDYTKEWVTLGEGPGAWLQLNWNTPYTVSRIVLHDRPNDADQITSAAITFDNGVTLTTGALENNGNGVEISVGPFIVNALRVTVITTSGTTRNIGLSEIAVYGSQQPNGNLAPIANAGADQTVANGSIVNLNGLGSTDPEGASLSYSWSQIAGPAVSLLNPSTPNPTFTAPSNLVEATTFTFAIVVNDGQVNSAQDWVSILVTATPQSGSQNIAPLATVTASSQNIETDQQAAKAVDGVADGYPSDYTREWATVNGQAGSWINLAWSTYYKVDRIELFDRPNTNDQITSATLTFSDGTVIQVDALDNAGLAKEITFAPKITTSVKLTVSTVSATSMNIGLSEIKVYGTLPESNNLAPTANAGTDQDVTSGAAVFMDGRASADPNNDPLTYTWSQVSGPLVTLTGANTSTPSFNAPTTVTSPTVLTFSLIVNDGKVNSIADTVNITVTPPVALVSLTPTNLDFGNQNVGSTSSNKSITLTNSGIVALSIESITVTQGYAVSHNCGSSLVAGGNCNISVAFSPTSSGTITGTVTITDNANGITGSKQTIALTGIGVNQAPVANAGADQTVNAGTSVTLNGSLSSDSNGDPLSYIWSQTAGPPVTLSGANTAKPSFIAPSTITSTTTLTFQLVVNDGKINSSSDKVNISVTPLLPQATVTPTGTLDFGNQIVGTTSTAKTVTLTNSGKAPLLITSIAVSGRYAVSHNCGSSLAVNTSCTIQVTFKPTATGTATGTLTITDNANGITGSKQTKALTGIGIVVVPTIPSAIRDDFNRADATTLGENWLQTVTSGIAVLRTNTSQATANYLSQTGHAYSRTIGGSIQGAGLTFANATVNNTAIYLKASGTLGATSGQLNNAIRVLYNAGSISVATTTNASASAPTYTNASSVSTSGSLVSGNSLLAAVDSLGKVWIWKKVGTTTTLLTSVGIQLPNVAIWTTGGGQTGLRLPNGARVDNFVAY